MIRITDIMYVLVKEGIYTSLRYDRDNNEVSINLNTQAKSELYLAEDGMLYGRYDYTKQIDLSGCMDYVIFELCLEFTKALHGRDYGNENWFKLCKKKGIDINNLSL